MSTNCMFAGRGARFSPGWKAVRYPMSTRIGHVGRATAVFRGRERPWRNDPRGSRPPARQSAPLLSDPVLEVGAQEAHVLAESHARQFAAARGVVDPRRAHGQDAGGLMGAEQRL